MMTGVKDLCDNCLGNDKAVDSLFQDLTAAFAEIIKYQKVNSITTRFRSQLKFLNNPDYGSAGSFSHSVVPLV